MFKENPQRFYIKIKETEEFGFIDELQVISAILNRLNKNDPLQNQLKLNIQLYENLKFFYFKEGIENEAEDEHSKKEELIDICAGPEEFSKIQTNNI